MEESLRGMMAGFGDRIQALVSASFPARQTMALQLVLISIF